jgi:hypothetical protein
MSQLNKASKLLPSSNSNEESSSPLTSSAVSTGGQEKMTEKTVEKIVEKKYPSLAEPNSIKEKKKRTALYSENLPTFYVGQGNNSELYFQVI